MAICNLPGYPPSFIRSLLCAQWVAKDPSSLHADSEDSRQTGRMPRLICLRWAHMPFCMFCHVSEHMRNGQRTSLAPLWYFYIIEWLFKTERAYSLSGIDALSGEATVNLCAFLRKKGSSLKGKNLLWKSTPFQRRPAVQESEQAV